MDTDAVRTFVAVADAGQFSGAAADLGVSQQAVSKRVATLEKELGVALFARIPRGAELTVDGRAFLPHARDLLRAEERAAASVRADRRALRVDVISRRIAPARLLQGFHEAHPDTPLEVVRLFDARAAIEAVRTGAVDVSFRAVTRPARELPAGVVTAWVLDEPVHLLVGPQHALAARDAVTLSELAGHPIWMPALDPGAEWTTFYDDLAAAFGLRIDVTGPGFGTEPLLDVIAGHPELATLLGEQTHLIWPDGFGLRRIPLRDPVPAYPHSLIWRADNAHPVLRALREHLARTRRNRAAGIWVPEWARLLYKKMIMAMQWANCGRSGNSGANSRRVAAARTCGGRDGHDHGPVAATSAVWPMIMALRPVRRSGRHGAPGSDVGPGPQSQRPALYRPPLVFTEATPHPRVLAGLNGPVQARLHYRTTMTNLLGLVDLKYRGPSVPDGEKQFGVRVTAGGVMAPVHEGHSFGQAGRVGDCRASRGRSSELVKDFTS